MFGAVREGRKRLQHHELGRLDLEFTIFQVAEQPSLRLYLYTPADEGQTEKKLPDILAPRLAGDRGGAGGPAAAVNASG